MIPPCKNNLWGIVLAGGSGTRLKTFTRSLYDHDRPKQYCAFVGTRTMVQHTIDRVTLLIDRKRMLTVVTEKHHQFVREQLNTFPAENIIVQPLCRETAPAVLLPIVQLYHRFPQSVAAIFPSDHFILNETKFIEYVQRAYTFVSKNPEIIVALGVRPDQFDDGYGWMKQGDEIQSFDRGSMYAVNSFIEKPHSFPLSHSGIDKYFWNTFVLVGNTETLLKHFQQRTPQLYDFFSTLKTSHDVKEIQRLINAAYNRIPSINFSKSILEKISHSLRVMDISDVHWSDWGEEHRIKNDVQRFNLCLNGLIGKELKI
jgi:mannose-1-phosphate guanylyltransferase